MAKLDYEPKVTREQAAILSSLPPQIRDDLLKQWKDSQPAKPEDSAKPSKLNESLAAVVRSTGSTGPQKAPKTRREFETDLKDVTAPKAEQQPYYHQVDSRGNSMAGLLKMRDETKSRKGKLEIREAIYAWSAEHDAQQKDKKQRAKLGMHSGDGSAIEQWKKGRNDSPPSVAEPKAELKEKLSGTVEKQTQQAGESGPPKNVPIEPTQPQTPPLPPVQAPPIVAPPVQAPPVDPKVELKERLSGAVDKQTNTPSQPAQREKEEKPPEGPIPTAKQQKMDELQLKLDVVGAAEPTPFADGTNAAISAYRAWKEPERRKEHVQNAAISVAGMVPYIGDTAKLFKAKRAAKTAQRANQARKGAKSVDATADAADGVSQTGRRATEAAEPPVNARQRRNEQRNKYRNGAKSAFDRIVDDEQAKYDSGGGRGGSPPRDGGPAAPMPPDDDNPADTHQRRRDEARGIQKHDEAEGGFWQKMEDGAGKVTGFTGKVVKAGMAIAGMVKGMELLNTGIIALNRDLAPYSGQMAGAYANKESRDIQRDMRKAQTLDGPMQELIEAQADLQDSIATVIVPVQAVLISVLTKVTEGVNFVSSVVGEITKSNMFLALLADYFEGEPNQGTAWQQFFRDVSDGKFDGDSPTFAADLKNDAERQRINRDPTKVTRNREL